MKAALITASLKHEQPLLSIVVASASAIVAFRRAPPSSVRPLMNADERFLFDLCGYIVVKDVLSPAVLEAANAAVTAHINQGDAVVAEHMKGREEADGPDTARWDLRGMLGWEDRAPFVEMLAHKKIVRFVNEICGSGHALAVTSLSSALCCASKPALRPASNQTNGFCRGWCPSRCCGTYAVAPTFGRSAGRLTVDIGS